VEGFLPEPNSFTSRICAGNRHFSSPLSLVSSSAIYCMEGNRRLTRWYTPDVGDLDGKTSLCNWDVLRHPGRRYGLWSRGGEEMSGAVQAS
jgi:hypothetical protein